MVSANLHPKAFTIHFLTPKDSPEILLPQILTQRSPVDAIVLGAGYTNDDREKLREMVLKQAVKGVPWLAAARGKQEQLGTGAGNPLALDEMEWYAKQGADRILKLLDKLVDEGKMKEDGVHFY